MEIIGWIVTVLFGVCYWPQLWRSYKTKSVGDVSRVAWLIQSLAYALAIQYGLMLGQWPMIVGYVHGLICSLVFIWMHVRYNRNV